MGREESVVMAKKTSKKKPQSAKPVQKRQVSKKSAAGRSPEGAPKLAKRAVTRSASPPDRQKKKETAAKVPHEFTLYRQLLLPRMI